MNNKLTDKAKEYLKEQLAYWPSSQRGEFHTWVKWAITDQRMINAQGLYTEDQVKELIETLKDCKSFIESGGIQWPHERKIYDKVLSALAYSTDKNISV